MTSSSHRKALALALLCTVQFMVVLDVAIVNVALPSIQRDLGFSQEDLQWVISAYALLFGGFLLLGGRAADLLGRRRVFLAGLVVFSVASLLSGLAWSEGALIGSRGLQGLGSAIISPAALSILTTTFAEGGERNKALVAWEARTRDPLMPFSIFRLRTLVGANVAGVILGTIIFSMFLMLTLYMQQVLDYSPLQTGVAYLAVAGTTIIWSAVAANLVTRVGVKPVLVAGMAFLTAGLGYFTQISVSGSYLSDLVPGFLLIAIGMGFSFVPISIAALAGVQASEAGLASGLINTSQQIGGALGIAALSALATSTTESDLAGGSAPPFALTDGFQAAFVGGACVALVGVLVALFIVRRRDLSQPAALGPPLGQVAVDPGIRVAEPLGDLLVAVARELQGENGALVPAKAGQGAEQLARVDREPVSTGAGGS